MLFDSETFQITVLSIQVSAIATAVSLLIGLLFGTLLAPGNFRGRSFVLEPELLLLDEPFSALDPPTRAKLIEDLSVLLKEDHRTAVFVTHNLNEAAKLSHRIAVIVGGRLRQVDRAQQIKAHPADEAVDVFLQELPQSQ